VGNLTGTRQTLDPSEPDPLDVPNDGDPHPSSVTDQPRLRTATIVAASPEGAKGVQPARSPCLTRRLPLAFQVMMHAVATIPPFEVFYETHSPEVLGLLRRKLGRDRADDAFQETFLRALRAYDRLDHGDHLRAWVLTIASRVAIDVHRRAKPTVEVPELPHEDTRPAYEDLGELTDGLPAKERAAVVLRYGYDLTYDQIAAALDSSPDAARQAASSGVRRLRKEKSA
jgi:RNA polymerase sigma factor (sigma-70 family)